MQINQLPGKEKFCTLAQKFNVIPVCVEILADTETPVSVLQKFYNSQQPVFLLESVEGGERWGRYSFLGISARYHIKVYRDTIEIQGNDTTEVIPHKGDPLGVMKSFMDHFRPVHFAELPRFWGGIHGITQKITTLRSVTELPICVGFGVSSPEHVADIASVADGVVIGSAFERIIEENLDSKELPSMLSSAVQSLKEATRHRRE